MISNKLLQLLHIKNDIKNAIQSKQNIVLTDVFSTYSGYIRNITSSAMNFYKCSSVNTANQTWSGYKAIFQGSFYYFSEVETTNLSYYGKQLQVNSIYSQDGLVKVSQLFNGIITDANNTLILVLNNSVYDETDNSVQIEHSNVVDGVLIFNNQQLNSSYSNSSNSSLYSNNSSNSSNSYSSDSSNSSNSSNLVDLQHLIVHFGNEAIFLYPQYDGAGNIVCYRTMPYAERSAILTNWGDLEIQIYDNQLEYMRSVIFQHVESNRYEQIGVTPPNTPMVAYITTDAGFNYEPTE